VIGRDEKLKSEIGLDLPLRVVVSISSQEDHGQQFFHRRAAENAKEF